MLIGKPPFETDSLEETYKRIALCDYYFPNSIYISKRAQDLIAQLVHFWCCSVFLDTNF